MFMYCLKRRSRSLCSNASGAAHRLVYVTAPHVHVNKEIVCNV